MSFSSSYCSVYLIQLPMVLIISFFLSYSEIIGNGIVYFLFTGADRLLDQETRMYIALTLLSFVLSSVLILSFLQPAIRQNEEKCVRIKRDLTFFGQISTAFAIVRTKKMMLACIYFSFIGKLEQRNHRLFHSLDRGEGRIYDSPQIHSKRRKKRG